MNFTEQFFDILCLNINTGQSVKVPKYGYMAEGTGLAYYPDLDPEGEEIFPITHLASGLQAGPKFYSEDDSRAFIEKIAPLIDWHQDAKAIFGIADLQAQIKRAVLEVAGDNEYSFSRTSKRCRKALLQKSKEIAGVQHE